MNRERDKARNIVGILLEYYVLHQFQNIKIDLSVENKKTIINISGSVNPEMVDLKHLEDIFKHPRMVEYDDYFDELLNSSDEQEINSIGYLIDEAKINLDNDLLSINIVRNHI